MNLALLTCAYGVSVRAPLLTTTKVQIVEECRERGISGWTCYAPTPNGEQCGECYACQGLQC